MRRPARTRRLAAPAAPLPARRPAALLSALVLLAMLAAGAAAAAGVPPELLQTLRWRSIGPFRGGRVLAVAGAPDAPNSFYFGAVNGGVWHSDDAGRSWTPIFDAAGIGSIGALAIAPSAPATLYVGTGEADMRSDIAQGRGLFRSTDRGASWSPAGLDDTQQIGAILVDPHDANTLLVAALGHPYGPNAARGVFRSTDGGRSWARTLHPDDDTGAIDLAAKPGDPRIVYAAAWQTRRPPWNVYPPSSGPGSALYRSGDGGQSWTRLQGHGLPDTMGRIGLATSPANPARVYALINGKQAGLYRSDTNGADWTRVSADPRITERGWYFSGITADPANADTLYVCDTILLRSTDGGRSFVALKGDPTGDDFHSLWIDPRNPDRRMLGVDQGALVSVNGGKSWSSWYNQPTGQFYHVSTDNRFPYRVYGAQQDSGAAGVDSQSQSGFDGISISQFHETAAGGESDNIAPDPDDPDLIYGGRVDRLDLTSGEMRGLDPTLAYPGDYRATWTLPLAWGRDHSLYFSNQIVFRTRNGGEHWEAISPDLTRPDPGVPATLDAPTASDLPESKAGGGPGAAPAPGAGPRRGVVYALAPSPLNARLLWAGTDDGLVWRTEDGGAHWRNVTPPALTAWSKIGIIEASHADQATAYIAVDRHRLDDPRPYLYATHDGGAHWTPIITGLPTGPLGSVNVVREDPGEPKLLYAGTESGAFVSFDTGGQWQTLNAGLPPTSVRDLVIHADDLVLATHGRGFYILDQMSQLRALARDPSGGPRLFAPGPAVRLHQPDFTGTPLPRDEPIAANLPPGMVIDYALAAPARTVAVTVADQGGTVFFRADSGTPPPKPDLGTLTFAPEWLPAPSLPGTGTGGHRVLWTLHAPVPAGMPVGEAPYPGLWAPPGRYTVTLTVDGRSLTQTARILPDPRLRLHAGDLDREYRLGREVEALRVRCPKDTAIAALAQTIDSADAAPSLDALSGVRRARERCGVRR